jgi:esterase/lipase superfamily enzyme
MLASTNAVSRRAVLRGLTSTGCVIALAGCADLAATGARLDASGLSANPVLLVATTRKPVNGARAQPWYGAERSRATNLARAKLAPPAEGRFSLASVGLDDWHLASIEPVMQVADLIAPVSGSRNVLIYVHGFNQTFETAALDTVHLSDGIRFRGDTMVFSWPSKAKLFDYAYDRESAMWSRDALQQVIEGVLANPGVGRVHIVAHSIGTMVAMEALRQLYAVHGETIAPRIGAVVLASPDVDMDVFSSSVERIGSLAPNIIVVAATNDRALALSRWIAGGITRVGAAEKARLTKLGLRVVDASQEGWGIVNHDLFLSNSHVRQVIRGAIDGYAGMAG